MVCCFAQEDATVMHLLGTLAVHLILPGPASFLSSPSMGSEGTAVLAAVHSFILTNCGCVIFFHHTPHSSKARTLGPQDSLGRQEGQV